jgi:pilus assembly protein CpaB
VLKVVKDDASEEKASYALIIALSVSDILKLEMARKLGDVQIIHSGLVSGNLTFKSSDILGTKHTIRELRGNDSQ